MFFQATTLNSGLDFRPHLVRIGAGRSSTTGKENLINALSEGSYILPVGRLFRRIEDRLKALRVEPKPGGSSGEA
jgi:hypothetical protein